MMRHSSWRAVPMLAVWSISGTAAVFAAGSSIAEMKLRDGTTAGQVEVVAAPGGSLVRIDLKGLTPGGHAIKVHEIGLCDGDFAGAGPILNPLGAGQGLLNEQGPAAGDLPNIFAGPTGEAKAEFISDMLQPFVQEGDVLADEDGVALIIYDQPDDHLGLAEGVAGERIACGVLSTKP